MENQQTLGRWGEQAAADYLRREHYKITGMNWSCRFGELDVIAEDAGYIVFVEVKLRRDALHGAAREFVTPAKQRRVILAARFWLQSHPAVAAEKQPRFDVIEIYGKNGVIEEMNHIENAFGL